MTFGLRNFVGAAAGARLPKGLKALRYAEQPLWLTKALDLFFFEHYTHLLELAIAVLFYHTLWDYTFARAAAGPALDWVGAVIAFNFAAMLGTFGFWHWWTFHGPFAAGLARFKFNPEHPYAGAEGAAALRREVLFTSLGWAHSAALQCIATWAYASGRAPFYADFWSRPAFSLGTLLLVNLWRTTHFYWVHRLMHPWGWRGRWAALDPGAWLYRRVHALHHKSTNPGPWAGLSMHPIEHLLYYSCAWVCLALPLHPLVFLFAKFHADVSPVGGHDGHEDPGGGGNGYHWLHHHRFECNYGVPTIDWDRMCGTFVDTAAFKECNGDLERARELTQRRDAARGWGAPLREGASAAGAKGKAD
jgi:lathosterol oxidase